jgi:hypothetical protein
MSRTHTAVAMARQNRNVVVAVEQTVQQRFFVQRADVDNFIPDVQHILNRERFMQTVRPFDPRAVIRSKTVFRGLCNKAFRTVSYSCICSSAI